MTAPEKHAEIARLAALLCDGRISEAERGRLGQILLDDHEAQTYYRQYIALDVALEWTFVDRTFRNPSAEVEPAETPPRSPILGFLGGVVDYVNHSRRLMFLLVAVMLCSWFVFQIGSVLLGRWFAGNGQVADRDADHPGGQRPTTKDRGEAGAETAHGQALAWVSGSVSGRWQVVGSQRAAAKSEDPAFWEIGTEFAPGQQVKLVAGLAEITFRSGAKVVLTAPSQLAVTSASGTDLQVGKLAARVPHGATGFTVLTPVGSVVDLGTEFGVEVTPDHKLDVQVFVGEVQVSSTAGEGREAAGPQVHVGAGKTAHIELGQPAQVVESKDKDRFQRDLKIASDSRDKQVEAYLELMRQLKPVVWFRMEGKETDRVLHDEVGGSDAKLSWDGPGNPFVKGPVGKALWLRGDKLKDRVFLPDYLKAEHDKLTVSAWAYAISRPRWAMIAKNWSSQIRGQIHFGLNSMTSADGLDLSVYLTQRDGKMIELREGAAHPFPYRQWQHVAFTTDGTTLRLYRQGREVAVTKHVGIIYPSPVAALEIGARTFDAPVQPSEISYWDGELDEIAIFNDTLTAEDIRKLAEMPVR